MMVMHFSEDTWQCEEDLQSRLDRGANARHLDMECE